MNGGGGQNGQKSRDFRVRDRATGGQGGQKRKTNAVARARAAKLSRPGLVTPRKGDYLRYVDGTLGHGGGTPGHGGLARKGDDLGDLGGTPGHGGLAHRPGRSAAKASRGKGDDFVDNGGASGRGGPP